MRCLNTKVGVPLLLFSLTFIQPFVRSEESVEQDDEAIPSSLHLEKQPAVHLAISPVNASQKIFNTGKNHTLLKDDLEFDIIEPPEVVFANINSKLNLLLNKSGDTKNVEGKHPNKEEKFGRLHQLEEKTLEARDSPMLDAPTRFNVSSTVLPIVSFLPNKTDDIKHMTGRYLIEAANETTNLNKEKDTGLSLSSTNTLKPSAKQTRNITQTTNKNSTSTAAKGKKTHPWNLQAFPPITMKEHLQSFPSKRIVSGPPSIPLPPLNYFEEYQQNQYFPPSYFPIYQQPPPSYMPNYNDFNDYLPSQSDYYNFDSNNEFNLLPPPPLQPPVPYQFVYDTYNSQANLPPNLQMFRQHYQKI